MVCSHLGQYEKLLPSPHFTRLDRSLILNLQAALTLKRKSRDEACLILDGVNVEIPLGRTAQTRFLERLRVVQQFVCKLPTAPNHTNVC
jgi:DNA-binding LytR/AlgR family response regulator